MWRDLVKRCPDRDPRRILEDLIALHGRKGKRFAAAKTAGYLDIALDCASDPEATPAPLFRGQGISPTGTLPSRPGGLHAIAHLSVGRGFDASPDDIDEAIDHFMAANRQLDRMDRGMTELRQMADRRAGNELMARSLRNRLFELEISFRNAGA